QRVRASAVLTKYELLSGKCCKNCFTVELNNGEDIISLLPTCFYSTKLVELIIAFVYVARQDKPSLSILVDITDNLLPELKLSFLALICIIIHHFSGNLKDGQTLQIFNNPDRKELFKRLFKPPRLPSSDKDTLSLRAFTLTLITEQKEFVARNLFVIQL